MARLWLGAAIALALMLTFAPPAQADGSASRSGAWSDPATWGGGVPGAGDAVTIGKGRTVTVDTAARARQVRVAEGGTLAFAEDKTASLELRGNLVVEGALEMVAPNPAVQQAIRFVGVDEGAFRGGGHEVLASDVGLWAHHHGRLNIQGAAKTSWSRTRGVEAGGRELALESPPVGWRAGDELVVVPSTPPTGDGFADAFDEVKVRSVAGARVALDRPLEHDHPTVGGAFNPEVLNLTRNVRIGGTPDGHAHVMSMAAHKQVVNYAQLQHVGVAGAQGRYGLHFHEAGDASRGTQVVGTVVRDAGNHAFVAHASHGVQFKHTVSYDTEGDAYWWDPGPDTDDVLYDFAVAALVTAPEEGPDKFRLCGFRMMQGTGNTVRNSVAVGVQGSTTSAGFHWPEEGDPHGEWTFQGNASHNNALHGSFNWQNDSREHDIEDSVFYHNGEYGIDHGAYLNTYLFKGVTLFGNGEAGLNLRAGSRDGDRGLRFDDLLIDGGGVSEHGIVADDHTLPAENGPTQFSRTELRGSTGAAVAMGEAEEPYAIDFTDSNVPSYDVEGGGNRLSVNGDERSGSGRIAAAVKLDQPGAPPLARIPNPGGRPAASGHHGPPAAQPTPPAAAHQHDPTPVADARAVGHSHGEGLFGLTIPLLGEPLDAKHAIGLLFLAVLIPSLCWASVQLDRRYRRKMELRARRPPSPAPPYATAPPAYAAPRTTPRPPDPVPAEEYWWPYGNAQEERTLPLGRAPLEQDAWPHGTGRRPR
jgi:G8 domain